MPERPLETDGELRRVLSGSLRIDEFRPLAAVVQVEFGAHSRTGLHRKTNEDHYVTIRLGRHQDVLASSLPATDLPSRFDEYGYAMLVADGVGRSGSGGLASRVAIATITHLGIHFGNWNLRIDPATAEDVMERAVWFYERAARAVDLRSQATPELLGMGTSLTATFSAGDELFYAHVGHSRGYVFRGGELTQLTRDHTLDQHLTKSAGPVAVPPGSQRLSQVLTEVVGGGRGLPSVDIERFRVLDQDVILLCTTGLCQVVDDDTIADVLTHVRRPDEQCRQLTEIAIQHGTVDDATALIARYSVPPLPTSR